MSFPLFTLIILIALASVFLLSGLRFVQLNKGEIAKDSSFSWVRSLDIWVGLFILLFLGLSAYQAAGNTADQDYSKLTPRSILSSQLGMLFVIFPIVARLVSLPNQSFGEALGVSQFQPKEFIKFLAISLISVISINLISQVTKFTEWLESIFGELSLQMIVEAALNHPDKGVLVAIFISAVIFAPIFEELIFRGYLLPVLTRFTNQTVALIWQALFFAVIHVNILGFLGLFTLGLILGISYLKSKTIWVPIAIHASFNAISLLIMLSSRT